MRTLGSLESGKRADVVVRSARAAEAYPSNNPLHLLALTMGTGSVDTVLVNGKVVFSGGHSTRVDEQEVYRTVSDSVVARAGGSGLISDSGGRSLADRRTQGLRPQNDALNSINYGNSAGVREG